jgi:FkbM family methyltransferase
MLGEAAARRTAKLARLLTFATGRRGLRYGVAAAVEHRRALAGLDVATVVDIGANKGQFALMAMAAFPAAVIYSFEPLEEPARRLRRTLGTKVTLFETAVGPTETNAVIHVSKRSDSSSLLPIGRQREIFPGTELREKRRVPVAPLAKYLGPEQLRPPAMLKIDVQGYELEVLKACDPLLHLFRFIYLEASFTELYQGQPLAGEVILYLERRNFRISGIYNQVEDAQRKPVQADFLFTCELCRRMADEAASRTTATVQAQQPVTVTNY